MSPEKLAARRFMSMKGYPDAEPFRVYKVDERHCYYFYYDLPEGELELEVSWENEEWVTTVTFFALAE